MIRSDSECRCRKFHEQCLINYLSLISFIYSNENLAERGKNLEKNKIKINKKAQQLSKDTEIKVNTQFPLHYHRPSSISCLHKRLIKHRVPNYLWILSSSPLIRFYSTIVDMDDGNNEKKLILLRIDNGNGNYDVDYFHLAINFNHIFFNATHRFNNNKKKVVVEHIVGAGHRAFN